MSATRPSVDVAALQQALDIERRARGMTWAELARTIHVSVPTLRQMHKSKQMEADAVLLILQWLQRRCADFTIVPNGAVKRRGRRAPPPAVPPLYARIDTIAMHAALDRARIERKLTWDAVADELGLSPSVIARFTKGGRTTANVMVAVADWAGEPVEALLQPSQPVLGYARMDAKARASAES